jgi:hypothetical protein
VVDISDWTYSDYDYFQRLRARQRLALEYAAHAALPQSEESRCRGANGMLDKDKVVAWFRQKYPKRACEIETGIAERSAAAKALYHRRRAS